MINKVFAITAQSISSMVADDESIKLSGLSPKSSMEDFQRKFANKLSLTPKVEIKYDRINSIEKEHNDTKISIYSRSKLGLIPNDYEFSFDDPRDYEIFYEFLVKQRYFTRVNEAFTPFKAIKEYLIGLIFTIAFTIFSYYQAGEIANGTEAETDSAKTMIFNYLVGKIGENGVILIGGLVSCFILYKIITRYKNPPNHIKFLPPNI